MQADLRSIPAGRRKPHFPTAGRPAASRPSSAAATAGVRMGMRGGAEGAAAMGCAASVGG